MLKVGPAVVDRMAADAPIELELPALGLTLRSYWPDIAPSPGAADLSVALADPRARRGGDRPPGGAPGRRRAPAAPPPPASRRAGACRRCARADAAPSRSRPSRRHRRPPPVPGPSAALAAARARPAGAAADRRRRLAVRAARSVRRAAAARAAADPRAPSRPRAARAAASSRRDQRPPEPARDWRAELLAASAAPLSRPASGCSSSARARPRRATRDRAARLRGGDEAGPRAGDPGGRPLVRSGILQCRELAIFRGPTPSRRRSTISGRSTPA